jgi:hypothetical protein
MDEPPPTKKASHWKESALVLGQIELGADNATVIFEGLAQSTSQSVAPSRTSFRRRVDYRQRVINKKAYGTCQETTLVPGIRPG